MKRNVSSESNSVRVILDESIEKPWCAHGPTLLFESTSKDTSQKFFACSACRDRKDCSFYLEYNSEKLEKPLKKTEQGINGRKSLLTYDEVIHYSIHTFHLIYSQHIFLQFQSSNVKDRFYCMKCHSVYLKSQTQAHLSYDSIPFPKFLAKPSEFLPPKSNDKKEAQYFFTPDTLTFFTRLFRQLSINKVLCVGAPAMHDELLSHGIKSFLLDIDDRLFSFYPQTKFGLYNMFNHHFFRVNEERDSSKKDYLNFLKDTKQTDSICIFSDPPFGCLTEPLSDTLRKVQSDYRTVNEGLKKVVPIILVFPYFMETYVRKVMPELSMSDYKINYANHSRYNETSNARKDLGSPIRFFSNILSGLIKLPKEQYRFCGSCERFVCKSNSHCKLCGFCPSKNGATYKHCKVCHKCVKPNYVHCIKCAKCTQKSGHKCSEYRKFLVCTICKGKGHSEITCDKLKLVRRRQSNGKKRNNKKNCLLCLTDGHTHFTCPDREQLLVEIQKFEQDN